MKVTQWFSVVSEKPEREGWYEYAGTMIEDGCKLYWNGQRFVYWLGNMEIHMAECGADEWRGLAEKP